MKVLFLLGFVGALGCSHALQPEVPPNIIIILADDMGMGDPGCYNPESKITTPAINRLAEEGMRFTDAHSPSAVCTPTRYGLLTGRYCWRSRQKRWVLQGYSPALIEENRATIASFLKEKGYATYGVGKWHLGLGNAEKTDYAKPLNPGPLEVGFDHWFGIPASLDMTPYVYVRDHGTEEEATEETKGGKHTRNGGTGFWRSGPSAPSFKHEEVLPRITEEAVSVIQKQSKNQPFFLYLPFSAPHTPWLPIEKFRNKTGAGTYGDFVAQVDHSVQKILQTLDEKNLTENTLVIFTSDNGAHWTPQEIEKYQHRANLHLRGQKADIWEGGHRVPFVVRWPKRIAPNTTNDSLIGLQDLFATITDLHGAIPDVGQAEDSKSLLPQLLGEKNPNPRQSLVHHSGAGMFALRSENWKLIDGLSSGGFTRPQVGLAEINTPEANQAVGQLYDLDDDPAEKNNLWLSQTKKVQALQRQLQEIRHGKENISYRGLHADGKTIWASGTGGNIRRSLDGGQTWADCSVTQGEDLDFRDIEGLGPNTAIAMSAGPGKASRVFRTIDGGFNWKEVARCPSEKGFWDGIAFWDKKNGLLVGDPINGRLALWRTEDGGKTWQPLPAESRPQVAAEEYCFAASGTSLTMQADGRVWIATGGSQARVFRSADFGRSWTTSQTPIQAGTASTGIFSIHMRDSQNGLIIGGDYQNPSNTQKNLARTKDGGATWQLIPNSGIGGYRSCVNWQEGAWRATGINGSEISWNDGTTWHPLGSTGYNAAAGRVFGGEKGRLRIPLATPPSTNQPNILFFLVDDLGWQDTSVPFANQMTDLNRRYRTPAMERLAAEGLKFTQAYTASPVCSPTRTSILSGKNPARSHITQWIPGEGKGTPQSQKWANPIWNQNGLTAKDPTLPRSLAAGGYQTAHLGKAHFGKKGTPGADPTQLGFQVNVAGSHIGHPGSFLPPYGKVGHSHRVPDLDDLRNTGRYLNDALTDKTLAVLDAFATQPDGKPFFIHLAHYAVHTPIQGDPALLNGYADDLTQAQRHYATMVESFDQSLNRILTRLDELGLTENTLVVFFSDNGALVTHGGPPTDCEPLSGGKGTMREGGTRVPMLVRWPGHTLIGAEITTPMISDDFFPTLMAAANLPMPVGEFDGVSILPLLQNQAISERTLLWHWPHYWANKGLRDRWDFIQPFTSLRDGDWKITWRWDDQHAELFDLSKDLGEKNDLAEVHPQKRDQLLSKLRSRLQEVNAPRPRHHESLEPVAWPGE
ncbi:MAG: sulfatase-like hydrolase/transferase [Planctomycetota bacterium]|nr:sulfatase-like hydrolase/transferase [Planctomycetota bacterium]